MMKSMKSSSASLESRDLPQEEANFALDHMPSMSTDPQIGPGIQDKLYKPHVQSGLFGASANLVNAIVGAGIIGIPYALKQSGEFIYHIRMTNNVPLC